MSENHELFGCSSLLPGLRVIKTKPRRPLSIRQSKHPHLPALRQMSLDRPQRCMVLPTRRPVLHVHAELNHTEPPIQQIIPETRRLTTLFFRLHREIKHHQAPHRVIRHLSHPRQPARAPATTPPEGDQYPLRYSAQKTEQAPRRQQESHDHPHQNAATQQRPEAA